MLETRARVVELNGHTAWVVAHDVSGCEQCNGQGCGSSKVAQLFCSEPRKFSVENKLGAGVGEEVVVEVVDGAILRGIALLYLMPLALMVTGGVLGNGYGHNDISATLGGVLGLMAGFALAKWQSARQLHGQPTITRRWYAARIS